MTPLTPQGRMALRRAMLKSHGFPAPCVGGLFSCGSTCHASAIADNIDLACPAVTEGGGTRGDHRLLWSPQGAEGYSASAAAAGSASFLGRPRGAVPAS